jgi:hypothetical protein
LTKTPKTYSGEKTVSSTNVAGKLSICMQKTENRSMSLTFHINSKWIKDLNIRPKTLTLVEEIWWNTLELIVIDNNFLNRPPMVQQLRERMDKWDYIKLKSFCTTKEMVNRLKRA